MTVYWFQGKPKALTEREQLLGLSGKKMGATVTEPRDFFSMIETIQKPLNDF